MRIASTVVSCFATIAIVTTIACRDNFDDYQTDAVAQDWELQSVEGVVGCTATEGLLQIVDVEGSPLSGDFCSAR